VCLGLGGGPKLRSTKRTNVSSATTVSAPPVRTQTLLKLSERWPIAIGHQALSVFFRAVCVS
jgi:hypothetical protein